MDRRHRANNFDFLRLIGAVLVIYGHAYPVTGSASPVFAANGVGTIGVKIFFVISGYLVAQSWLRDRDLCRFLLRRSLRIFPALGVVLLLSVAVLGPLMTTLSLTAYVQHPETLFYFRNFALYVNYDLPGVFEQNPVPSAVNASLWSLPAEFSMYLLTPILLSRVFNRKRFSFLMLTLIFSGLSILLIFIFPRQEPWFIYATNAWSWLEVAPYFVIGVAFAVCELEWLTNIYLAFVGILMLAIVDVDASVKQSMLMFILPYACLSFGLGHTPLFERITRGNDLSYGIFLFGFPVQQAITAMAGAQIGPWANCLASLTVCIGLAHLSWNFIERPMVGRKPGGGNLAPSAGAAAVVTR